MPRRKEKKRELQTHTNELKDTKKLKLLADDTDLGEKDTDDEEKDLESFLFGSPIKLNDEHNPYKENVSNENVDDVALLAFSISTKPGNNENIEELHPSSYATPVWSDDDDKEISVNVCSKKKLRKLRASKKETVLSGTIFQERLKSQFEKVTPAPSWADVDNFLKGDKPHAEEDDIFKKTARLLSRAEHLQKGILQVSRLRDLNYVNPSNATITNVEFHPNAKIAFTSSLNKRLDIFQADGDENRKLQSIHLARFPIYAAHFTPDGKKVVMSSRRKFYYIYDLVGGQVTNIPEIRGRDEKSLEKFVLSPDGELIAFLGTSGYIHLVSTQTNQWVSSLKMNGKVNTATFSHDSSKLYTGGGDGEVYIWDVKSRRCQHRFIDDGSLSTTSITVSNNGKYMACGSSSGVVNIYNDKLHIEKNPTPEKILLNLSTGIDGALFNPTNEILAYYSPQVRNGLKLVHFPSLTTFSNWPIEKQTLGNVSCIDFSPLSGYLGIGNETGKALLFRLSHYPDS